ncbi:MAG TPA: response regulator transcription factor [Solirubrobacteraceae bacterium]|nr:response regulator transcription factor [Solirubrobacteraceae bacterium]
MKASKPTVVIADDHQITRLGVRSALSDGGFDVLAEASDGRGAVDAVLAHSPDVCLLDILMPRVGGLEAAAEISGRAPATLVVMLTVSDRIEDVLGAMRAGAVGYLPKDTRPDRLPAALCGVIKGEAAFPRTLMGRMLGELQMMSAGAAEARQAEDGELTPREAQILELLRAGASTIQIGRMLSLSPITVRRHISASMAKLGVSDRDAALRAVKAPPAA